MKLKENQRVYIKSPAEITSPDTFIMGEIKELYVNDLGIEMAEVALDGPSIHSIYISQEMLRPIKGEQE